MEQPVSRNLLKDKRERTVRQEDEGDQYLCSYYRCRVYVVEGEIGYWISQLTYENRASIHALKKKFSPIPCIVIGVGI